MFWADQIVEKIIQSGEYKPYWVDDMKTPSGRIHVGSLRGVLIHDFIFKALLAKGKRAKYTYVYNDMDRMDALPAYLDKKKHLPHMGKPLFKIPAPDGGEKSYARFYADEFTQTMQAVGAKPEIIWSSQLYASGKMDTVIRQTLDNAGKIQDIFHKIAGYDKEKNWFPFQVICPQCGKVATTSVYKWDGKNVYYRCEKEKVDWTQGCGYQNKVSPFGGTGKLPWKIDWPAHWKVIGVTIEGAGKDHSSAGGSRDIAKALLKEVFAYPNPFDIPYEWFVIRGTKMSSSKGIGTPAKDFVDHLQPEVARFLFARSHYNKVIDFNPEGNTMADLYDEYDRCAKHYFAGKQDDYARMFEVSQIGKIPKKEPFLPRFREMAQNMQLPNVDLAEHFRRKKGAKLTEEEKKILETRKRYAKIWLEKYAPESLKVQVVEKMTAGRKINLSKEQREYLVWVKEVMSRKKWDPKNLQQELYEGSKRLGLPTKEAFAAIYLTLLGKSYGPKAAWLLLENKKKFLAFLKEICG